MSSPPDEQDQDFPGHLLHQAALWDNGELLLDLLNGELISHINSQDSWGRTPLHASCTTDESQCLHILLRSGANPNIASGAQDNFKTPLHTAAEHGLLKNVRKLTEFGADPLTLEGHGYTAIDLAERSGHVLVHDFLKRAATAKEEARETLYYALREASCSSNHEIVKKFIKEIGPAEMQLIVNLTPNGTNTLLFKACESGNKELVNILLDNGADGSSHPVTRYSPLYIACYYGHKEIVSTLLKKFPLLVQVPTVEKWLPIHACCINGHFGILEMLLKYDYPPELMQTFRHFSGDLEYDMAFDINMKDVSGQNALYIACQMGNQRLVDILLKHKVDAKSMQERMTCPEKSGLSSQKNSAPTSPIDSSPKKKLSGGIHDIITKLSKVTNQILITGNGKLKQDNLICPVDINAYCEDYQTPLHVAVKQRHHVIASSLLNAKADPNLKILPSPLNLCQAPAPYGHSKETNKRKEDSSTALIEACSHRDLGMIELLLKYGARDVDGKALQIVSKDDIIVGKILALKAHHDAENKINIGYLNDNVLKRLKKQMLASSILPTSTVTINWHGLKLDRISENWLITATLRLNPRLRLCPKNQSLGLHALTRIDLSSNSLEKTPSILFTLCSLKYLNLSQNKLSELEFPETICNRWLEELLLHENRFEKIPSEIFTQFPSLNILNLSNNKLHQIPSTMWTCSKLTELNLSLNLLSDLPGLSSNDSNLVFDSLPYFSTQSDPDGLRINDENSPQSPDFVMVDFDKQQKTNKLSSSFENSEPLIVHQALWRKNVNISVNEPSTNLTNIDENLSFGHSSLTTLNLSHNAFVKIPKVLACLGLNVQRLNMSFNNLKYLGFISEYPACLKQLDLSNNQIEKWFSNTDIVSTRFRCHAEPIDSYSNQNLNTSGDCKSCIHKNHSRLDQLKTLILFGNLIKSISISSKEEILLEQSIDQSSNKLLSNRNSLWFPNITMLDLSDNIIREVSPRISELVNLSVLNISGNPYITDLPPEMGLLSRMWNLNTNGCNFQEPLKSMIESKRCKTMDIIGYLKSVLEDAKIYSRIKLMVVGIQGIGKTSLLQQLRNEGNPKHLMHQQDHWAKRMGTTSNKTPNKTGKPISTVGVDISSWVLNYKGQQGSTKGNSSTYGPVVLRTWDFGGQKEYYATHLYFLSRRSLYLVVWNICDGEKGLNEIVQWLVNIQARAPNSPVIIVGTHYDYVNEKFPPGYLDYLQQKIKDKFICITDPEKNGLPKVICSIEISCKTRHNIRHLSNLIYETVYNIKTTNGKRLLEQKIPSKYIHLEEIVAHLATDRKSKGLDPVISEQEFKTESSAYLSNIYGLTFRDDAEIMQACSFLHENGVLLHYEDSTLRDLYFLDPQWLCDMLAHVVTVREINPFAKNGIMKVEDLRHLFKGQSNETRDYILSLLSKFELAVPWDSTNLLIPSLLPTFDQMRMGQNEIRIQIPVRSRGWALKNRVNRMSRHLSEDNIKAMTLLSLQQKNESLECGVDEDKFFNIQKGKILPLNRFVLLSYFPSGFWPRLISRVLSDDRIVEIIRNYFNMPAPSDITSEVVKVLDEKAEFCCWQTGMELVYGDLLLLRMKEITGEKNVSFMVRRDDTVVCEAEIDQNADENEKDLIWDTLDLAESGLLEIHLPAEEVVVKSRVFENIAENSEVEKIESTIREIRLEPAIENLTKLLALITEHVDTLLEDFYPSIGTRFVHTSEGKYLVTRVVPCPYCFPSSTPTSSDKDEKQATSSGPAENQSSPINSFISTNKSQRMSSDSGFEHSPRTSVESVPELNPSEQDEAFSNNNIPRGRIGYLLDSPKSFKKSNSALTGLNIFLNSSKKDMLCKPGDGNNLIYSWSVEYCILRSQKYADSDLGSDSKLKFSQIEELKVKCPRHGQILLRDITPDVLFLDLNSRFLLDDNLDVQRGKLLGRGSFGFVFGGKLIPKYETKQVEIAIKMFQPIDPGRHNTGAIAAYKAAKNKWNRAPAQSATRAYITARGEVRVLYWVAHPNVVPFLGLCQSPLSIVMPKAPRGSLDTVLSDFKRSSDKVCSETIRIAILQLGKALEYLHNHRIIYRDLKSENVLVWEFPQPFCLIEDVQKVDLKLADYGISRSSFATGNKGFGGTEGYMAPEIIRFNGEEEYTEKVDIFSFGMLLYEMITLKQPFDECENVKESILEGIRPPVSQRDCDIYSLYILDLMVVCWQTNPKERPTASQIVGIASSPEFTFLRDSICLSKVTNIVAAVGIQYGTEREVWLSVSTGGIYCLKLKTWTNFESCHCFEFIDGVVTSICQVDDKIWMGDTVGKIHIQNISDYSKVLEYELEHYVGYCGAVISIKSLDVVVAVAVSSGRLFICNKINAQLLTELGKSSVIHCLTTRLINDGLTELWTGEKAGRMTVFTLKNGAIQSQEIINHYEQVIEAVEVLLLNSHVDGEIIYSYVYPGSTVYGWDCIKKEMISRLDVGKILPVRESIEEELNNKPLQITVLQSSYKEVYIGTNWGFVFLADSQSLRPITSFRPFTNDVRAFWIFRRNEEIANNDRGEKKESGFLDVAEGSTATGVSSNTAGEVEPNKTESYRSTREDFDDKESCGSREASPVPPNYQQETIQSPRSHHKSGGSLNSSQIICSPIDYQLVIGIGKGCSNLIEKNLGTFEKNEDEILERKKRRAFAFLWHVQEYDSWE